MGVNIYIPDLETKKANVKDLIVLLLSQEWPLTTKKTYNQLQKRYAKTCTYQAVFKAMKELEENKVLEKTEDGYRLDTAWLKKIQQFTKTTETRYFTKDRHNFMEGIKETKQEGNISILTFASLFDVEKYLYYLQKEYVQRSDRPKTICYHHKHEWRPIYYLRAEYNWLKKLLESRHNYYILCAGNTVVDKHCAKFYKSMDANIRLNANCASTCELAIIDDLVIEIYIPSTITEAMDKEFSKVKEVGQLKIAEMTKNIFEKEEDIQVIIRRDKNISKQVQEYTLGFFRKPKGR